MTPNMTLNVIPEKPKAAKAPAKLRKTAATAEAKPAAKPRKVSVKAKPPAPAIAVPTHQQIALLAEKYWAERGWQDGAAEQDWLRAELELMKLAS